MARFSKDGYWDYYRSLPDSLRSREHQLQLLRCGHVINDTGIYERAEYPFTVWEEVISGEGFVSVGDQSFTVRKGDIYVLPRGKCSRLEPHARHTWQKKYFLLSGSKYNCKGGEKPWQAAIRRWFPKPADLWIP